MRFAFYGRVANDRRRISENSIAYQRAECEKKLAHYYPESRIVSDFVDVGCAGNNYRRPALRKLLHASLDPNREFDHVIVFDISRISREAGLLDVFMKVIEPEGIEIIEAMDSNDLGSQGTGDWYPTSRNHAGGEQG
jgi:DNA invertase Pin-like site-specific DNA recombinase